MIMNDSLPRAVRRMWAHVGEGGHLPTGPAAVSWCCRGLDARLPLPRAVRRKWERVGVRAADPGNKSARDG
jgi:hypothetical protein